MEHPIACNLSVFTPEERTDHGNKSSDIFKSAKKKTELEDGYSFGYDYSPDIFISLSKWIINENRCCPFFTFELVLEPTGKEYTVWLKLRGSDEIKKFLKANNLV